MAAEVPAKKTRFSEEEHELEMGEEKPPTIQQQEQTRILRIDISQYSPTIQKMTNEELVQVFNIGVAVKESFTLTILENSSFVKEELEKQMKPIHGVMDKLPNEVEKNINKIDRTVAGSLEESKRQISQQVNDLKDGLVKEVSEVSKKVLPVGKMEERIIQEIKSIDKAIKGLEKDSQKPTTKGVIGENKVLSILQKNFPNYTIKDVSKERKKGDYRMSSPEGHQFLIEVKYYQTNVPKAEIEKFKTNVLSGDVKVGIMLSDKSGIAMKCKNGKFEVNHREGKFLIYVPNALAQQEVVIWSVSLATELAGLDVEINDNQAEKLRKFLERFHDKLKDAEKCREKIETLKYATKGLEESIKPIFDMIKDAEKELKSILKPYSSKTAPHASASTSTSGSQTSIQQYICTSAQS